MTNYAAHTSTRYQRTVRLTDDAPQVTDGDNVTVQAARLDYSWSDDGLPQVVEVSGLRVRKDGSLGARRTIVLLLVKAPSSFYATAPQWVRDLVTTDPS